MKNAISEVKMSKPKVKLIGKDGNAFAILGACSQAAKKAGIDKTEIDKILKEMMAGDYNHLLQTAHKYFTVS